MTDFTTGRDFRAPPIIYVGRGALLRLPEALGELGVRRATLITDRVMGDSTWTPKLRGLAADAGVDLSVFRDLSGEPTTLDVEAALAVVRSADAQAVIGFGGGSALDTAKSAAALMRNPGRLPDYEGYERFSHAGLPVIAIPTTAGTGSEVTRGIAVTDVERDVKMLIMSAHAVPHVAIVDPAPTYSMPPAVTASTGLDTLTHAIEAYVSRRSYPSTDAFAIDAVGRVARALRRAYRAPDDEDAREQMTVASLHAGLAFSNASVALVHGMSRPIGAYFHVPHGLSNAMLLTAVLRFSLPGNLARYADVGRALGVAAPSDDDEAAAAGAVRFVADLSRDLEVPSLAGWGVDRDAFRHVIPQMAADALASGSPANNPRVPNQEEIVELYEQVIAAP